MKIEFNDIILVIPRDIWKKLKEYEQGSTQNEAGGIILGKYIPDRNKYIITDITVPSTKDKSGRLFFIRNKNVAQKSINELWKENNGVINYLGEWHTHPWANPKPSIPDLVFIKSLRKDKSNVWPELFMLIIGQNTTAAVIMSDKKNIIVKKVGYSESLYN